MHCDTSPGAERLLDEALKLFPRYHYALGNLVKVRIAQERPDDAVAAARDFCKAAPHPENLFVLGEALARAGKDKEAREALADFEKRALAESETADNSNRELVFYFADHAGKPAEALRIAEAEIARRQDTFTRHAYAWALYANGRFAEAGAEMEKALAVGVREPAFLYHAGMIALKLDDRASATCAPPSSEHPTPKSQPSPTGRSHSSRARSSGDRPTPEPTHILRCDWIKTAEFLKLRSCAACSPGFDLASSAVAKLVLAGNHGCFLFTDMGKTVHSHMPIAARPNLFRRNCFAFFHELSPN